MTNKVEPKGEINLRTFEDKECNCLVNSNINNLAGVKQLPESEKNTKKWFVLRDLKRSNANMPAYKQLDTFNIEIFTPMTERIVLRKGRKVKEKVPFIQDLLFAHSSKETLDPIIEKISTLQYRFVKGLQRFPMVVSDRDMDRFIHAVNTDNKPRFYAPEEITSAMCGRRVRIVGGALDNYDGFLQTTHGSKVKRLLIELPGLMTAGVELTNCDYIVLT